MRTYSVNELLKMSDKEFGLHIGDGDPDELTQFPERAKLLLERTMEIASKAMSSKPGIVKEIIVPALRSLADGMISKQIEKSKDDEKE